MPGISVAQVTDLLTDPTFLLWHGTAGAMLIFMSVLCAVLDHFKAMVKCQPYKSTFSGKDYLDAVRVALLNCFTAHWPVSLLLFNYWKYHTDGPTREFDWFTAAWHFVVCGLVIDVWFYCTHRALHYGSLYKNIHKQHHRFTAPCSLAAVYAHPIEFVIGNYMGVALGPTIVGAHPSVGMVWWAVCLFGTCLTHSGYGVNSSVHHHDLHHEFFNCNFGVSYGLDYLCGTDDAALGFDKAKEKKMGSYSKQKKETLEAKKSK